MNYDTEAIPVNVENAATVMKSIMDVTANVASTLLCCVMARYGMETKSSPFTFDEGWFSMEEKSSLVTGMALTVCAYFSDRNMPDLDDVVEWLGSAEDMWTTASEKDALAVVHNATTQYAADAAEMFVAELLDLPDKVNDRAELSDGEAEWYATVVKITEWCAYRTLGLVDVEIPDDLSGLENE